MAIDAPSDAGPAATKNEERRALGAACGAHVLHDGYADLIYVVLPVLQAEFGLTYAAVGLLRTAYSGTMASLQIPASFIAERLGGNVVLAGGTALAGLCFCLAGGSAGFPWLIAALVIGGIGASTQHPLGSALVARAFSGPRALTALSTYNVAGDVGKMLIPATTTALLLVMPWRAILSILGIVGIAAAVVIYWAVPRFAPGVEARQKSQPAEIAKQGILKPGYWILLLIGSLDGVVRGGFLVFLPFLVIEKGASIATGGFALTLVLVGGAAGKLVIARLARFGIITTLVITKALTAAGILAILYLPVAAALALLPVFGAVLNGPSSLTYGSVPIFATAEGRARAFSIFYTGTIGCAAITPIFAGMLGDVVGVPATVVIVAVLALLTLPLSWLLAPGLRAADTAV